jgi:pyruvate formate lyase activating enzyme
MTAELVVPAICPVCPHHCHLTEGQLGRCRARRNGGGVVVSESYGRLTSIALDPVVKKPLARFHPDGLLLSVGSYGCNMDCPFCQNASIAAASAVDVSWRDVWPEELVADALALQAQDARVIGIAYTYNEPFVSYEFMRDTARLAHDAGLLNVVVTNGMVCEEPLEEVLPFIDAFNIDLKTFNDVRYRSWGGDLASVQRTIVRASQVAHVEVTTLVIGGITDSASEINSIATWLASVDPDITYHLTRFFPCHRMADRSPTPVARVIKLAEVARCHLAHVETGNC